MERAAASAVQRAVGLCVLNAHHYNLVGKKCYTRVIGYVFNWLIYYITRSFLVRSNGPEAGPDCREGLEKVLYYDSGILV